MKIRLLTFDGCPNDAPTHALLEEVLHEEGIEAGIERVEVSRETAERENFLGSPTIQINGLDIEPEARVQTSFRMTCRVYCSNGNLQGVPPRELIEEALRRARLRDTSPARTHAR